MWANKYIGIPYKDGGRDIDGLDCWGLVRLVYKNEYGIDLPSFNNEYVITDRERVNELFNQYREGWLVEDKPKEGDVVLLRLLGEESHVGVLINDKQFLHVNYKTPAAIENLESVRWRNRIVGFNSYNPENQIILSGRPHPLKTQNFSFPVPPGTKLIEIVKIITKKYSVTKELVENLLIIVNGKIVDKNNWENYTVQSNDRVEYRAIPKGKIGRIVAFFALVIIAPYIAGFIQSAMAVGLSATLSATGAAMGIGGIAGMGATFAVASGTLGYALTAGVILAGSYLINAIAPVRLPDQPKDPGQAEQQMLATGVQNQLFRYETIPIVLGKMRITPPLGAQNFISYQSEADSSLHLFLCWGYGPLALNTETLRIGNISLQNYVVDAIEHLDLEIRDYDVNPSGISSGGGTYYRGTNNQTAFDAIYGNDIAQIFKNTEIPNFLHPNDSGGSLNSTTAPEIEVGAIPALISGDPPYTSIEIALHFPQGLRKIKTKDENAGEDYALGSQGPQIKLDISYDGGVTYTHLHTEQFGNTLGKKKDAFTVTRVFNINTINSITIRAQRLTPGASDPPNPGDASFTRIAAASGVCVDVEDNIITVTDYYEGSSYTYDQQVKVDVPRTNPAVQNQRACQLAGGTWRTTVSSSNEEAKKWRYCFQVNLLSITARRQAKAFIPPVNTQISRTAIRLISSKDITGQLEGINAIVQTIARTWNGTNWNTLAPTSNPASLFIYVLMSPANPRRILAAEMATKINLDELGAWYDYCENPIATNPLIKFRYNALLNGRSSVLDVLKDICAAGRASPTQIDGKWTVTIDKPKPQIVQYFSPHNSWGFESVRNLNKLPDGLRITFNNEDKDYQESEHIIFKSGKNRNNSELYETISLPGITKASLVEDHGRWHMAQAVKRREIYTLNTDMEYLVCNRGDRVTVAHDVPMWGLGSGRIKNVLSNTLIEVDDPVLIDPAINYIIRIRNSTQQVSGKIAQIPGSAGPAGAETSIIKSGFTYSAASRDVAGIVTLTISSSDPNPFSIDDLISVSGTLGGSGLRISDIGVGYIKYETTNYSVGTSGAGTIDLVKGLVRKLTLSTAVTFASEGDLFLIGNSVQKTNDLLVLGIETTTGKSAKILFTDYAEDIFTTYTSETNALIFNTNITLPPSLSGFELKDKPTIIEVLSDDRVSVLLANNIWKYKLRIIYSNFILDDTAKQSTKNQPGTVKQGASSRPIIQYVECEYAVVGVSNSNERSIRVPYNQLVIDIDDVQIGEEYRARLRYITDKGVAGPWTAVISSAQFPHMKIIGRDSNYGEVDELIVNHAGRYLEVTPVAVPTPKDFKHYEIRIWKNGVSGTATGDFWTETTFIGTTTAGSTTINITGGDTTKLRLGKTPQKISGTGSFDTTATVSSVTSTTVIMSTASTVTGNIVFTLDKEILALATTTGTHRQDLLQFERPRLSQSGIRYRVNSRVVSTTNTYSEFSGINHAIITNIPPGPSTVKPGIGSYTLEIINPTTGIARRTDAAKLRVYMSDQSGFVPNNDYAEIVGTISGTTLTVSSITSGRLAPGAILQGAGVGPRYTGYTGTIQLATTTNVSTGTAVQTTSRIILIKGLNSITNLRPGQYIELETGSTGSFGTVGGTAALAIIDTIDSSDQISVRTQTNTGVTVTAPTAGSVTFSISSGITSFSDISVSILSGPTIKAGQPITGTWTVSTSQNVPTPTTMKAFSNRVYDADGFLAYISSVYPEKKFYYRHAVLSELALNPDPDFQENYYYSDEKEITVFSSQNPVVDNIPPPTPSNITVEAGISSIIVKFETKPYYNLSGNTNDIVNSSSSHKATVMYMVANRNISDVLTFENIIATGAAEVHYLSNEQEYVTSIPAQPGTIYYIWFKNLSQAGVLSVGALGPKIVETGIDVEKLLHALTGKLTGGQLYNSLGSRINAIDRGNSPIATKVEQLEGQYTVKIDNSGNVAGYGLSSTGSGLNGATSQFGVRADYFWVAPVSHVSDTEPAAGDRYKGYVWVDTSSGSTSNVGAITGVDFYFDTYKPDVHNASVFPDTSSLQYWRQFTSEELHRRTKFRWRGTWSGSKDYENGDIVQQPASTNVYYFSAAAGVFGNPPLTSTTYWTLLVPATGLAGSAPDNLRYKDLWIPNRAYVLKDVVRLGEEFFECIKAYNPKTLSGVSTTAPPKPAGDGAETTSTAVQAALDSSTGHRFSCGSESAMAADKTVYAINSSTGTYNGFIGYSYNPQGTFYYTMATPAPTSTKFSLSTRLGGPGIVTEAVGKTKYWVRKTPAEGGPAVNIPDEAIDLVNDFKWTDDATRVPFPFVVVTQPLTEAQNNGVKQPTGVFIDSAFIRNATINNAKIADASIDNAKISNLDAAKITTGYINAGRIEAGSIDATKITAGQLDAISANMGVITAGIARSGDNKMIIDFNSKYIRIDTGT